MGRERLEAGSPGRKPGGEEKRESLGPIHGAEGGEGMSWLTPRGLAWVAPWCCWGMGIRGVEPRNQSPGGWDSEG